MILLTVAKLKPSPAHMLQRYSPNESYISTRRKKMIKDEHLSKAPSRNMLEGHAAILEMYSDGFVCRTDKLCSYKTKRKTMGNFYEMPHDRSPYPIVFHVFL